MSDILVVNKSRLLTAADIPPVIAAINRQIADDFASAWNAPGIVHFGEGPDTAWLFSLQDTIDQPGDLGYHIDDEGRVSAIIDVAACKASGSDWRTCLGHEVLETLADPQTSRMAPNGVDIIEICDPAEEDAYAIDGVPVTNFVLPAYFGWPGAKYDQMGFLRSPAPALRPGGYIMQFVNGAWKNTFGERATARPGFMASREGGRRAWRQKTMGTPA